MQIIHSRRIGMGQKKAMNDKMDRNKKKIEKNTITFIWSHRNTFANIIWFKFQGISALRFNDRRKNVSQLMMNHWSLSFFSTCAAFFAKYFRSAFHGIVEFVLDFRQMLSLYKIDSLVACNLIGHYSFVICTDNFHKRFECTRISMSVQLS